jgi:hypothetical protein
MSKTASDAEPKRRAYDNLPDTDATSEGTQSPRTQPRLILGSVLLVLVIAFAALQLLQNNVSADNTMTATGSVSGYAVNAEGVPIQAEIFVYGTDIAITSLDNGYFKLHRVPVGKQSIIVAHGVMAEEVKVTVEADQEIVVDTVTIPTDLAELFEGLDLDIDGES